MKQKYKMFLAEEIIKMNKDLNEDVYTVRELMQIEMEDLQKMHRLIKGSHAFMLGGIFR